MSLLAVTLTVPPFPQPELRRHVAPEAMKEPANRLMVCAEVVTEPALPELALSALMWLAAAVANPVEYLPAKDAPARGTDSSAPR